MKITSHLIFCSCLLNSLSFGLNSSESAEATSEIDLVILETRNQVAMDERKQGQDCKRIADNGKIKHQTEINDDLYHDSSHTIEIFHQYNAADEHWETFQKEIEWFLEYTDPTKIIAQRFSSGNKDDNDQENYLKEEWRREHDVLTQNITRAQSVFLEFREQVASSLASNYGDGQYAITSYAITGAELTKWYIEYMEKNLFPMNWKELYEQFLKEKNSKAVEKNPE